MPHTLCFAALIGNTDLRLSFETVTCGLFRDVQADQAHRSHGIASAQVICPIGGHASRPRIGTADLRIFGLGGLTRATSGALPPASIPRGGAVQMADLRRRPSRVKNP